jgi:predicted SAM-dependent methyltransferase
MAKQNVAHKAAQQKAQQRQAYLAALKKAKPFTLPEGDKKIVVSLGWGSAHQGTLSRHFKPEEWNEVRVDMDAAVNPDLVSSLHHIPAIPDASVQGVWIGHVLQRLSFPEASAVIVEAMRMLKDGGELLVAVPDMQLAATYLANGEGEAEVFHAPAGAITAIDMLFGFQKLIAKGETARIHKSGYTAESLGNFLRVQSVCNIHVQRHPYDLVALGRKLPYEHPDRVERIVMMASAANRPDAPAVPDAAKAATVQSVRFIDRLEDEPKLWKPLGLKK